MARSAAEEKLYKIGEVCKLADVQPYVLRYWETEFPQLAPNKSGGGQRLYTRREIDTILRIKELLYKEGFTIAGAKKKLESETAEAAAPVVTAPIATAPAASPQKPRPDLTAIRNELRAILEMLKS
ncbi:MAG TPA: MerR family transcriptional regulator [Thermoanaerobaculia bacterium]|nr:MerR family transcriptional regulator [Thermoanaerobaculia bacterium]